MEKRNNRRHKLLERQPFLGVTNVVLFNWHFYALSIVTCLIMLAMAFIFPLVYLPYLLSLIIVILMPTLISLIVTWYIYDHSGIYNLKWINGPSSASVLNINAGFDEISEKLERKFSNITIFDFYDPEKHTEISIKRARTAYPPHPRTTSGNFEVISAPKDGFSIIVLFFAAHEIRSLEEKVEFFKKLKHCLATNGVIFLVEHLQDWPNFWAYNFGFLHFASKRTWLDTFDLSELALIEEVKHTPFISIFTLKKA